jgi:7-carboxy-7-deazaguanine synthase (Cx14CxxC type)
MTYAVKEIFYTLQGEGAQAGRPAVFCRFAGCNLWSGREADRKTSVCQFCDTDFVGVDGTLGGKYEQATELAEVISKQWPDPSLDHRMVVLTGGEPLLQVDADLIDALHDRGFFIAVETNGTVPAPPGLDWLCVSPKANATLVQKQGHELKLVFPQVQPEAHPSQFESLDFQVFSLQPLDDSERDLNTAVAVAYCQAHPQWRLSMQTHKFLGIR